MIGHNVVARTDPLEALMLFKSEPDKFDLVITDMTMPNMKGDAFTLELKRIRPEIPIILCSGYNDISTANKLKKFGVSAIAAKPVSLKELTQLIRSVLDRKSH